ncbi:hypothetical protein [Streptomyces sp. NPDC053541]|uniref:hypothetical protein n=1 Tax=Streptomyces sp. NPDC053541 TaxID=3365709 RepID=UPI0037CFFBD0
MYGQGYPPPAGPQQRPGVPASVIVLRVLFAVLPLFSIGLLTWATALRIALLTRRAVDWVLFALSIVLIVVCLVLMPDDVETTRADVVVATILLSAAAFTGYYLAVDIRHDRIRLRGPVPPPAPYNPYAATVPQQAYGYPQARPQARPPVQAQPQPPVQPQPPAPVRPPQVAPSSPRIDQVRAELDELSDLLRKDQER